MTLLEHVTTKASKAALARVWVDLNRWEWPRDLPTIYKPHWWDGTVVGTRETRHRKVGFMDALMDYAIARAGDDAIQREWMKAKRPSTRKRPSRTKKATRNAS